MNAARGNGAHFNVDAIDALIGIHVQFGNKPASE
jgi:hypothetical protein